MVEMAIDAWSSSVISASIVTAPPTIVRSPYLKFRTSTARSKGAQGGLDDREHLCVNDLRGA